MFLIKKRKNMKQYSDINYENLCKEYRKLKKNWHNGDKSNDTLKKIKLLKQKKNEMEKKHSHKQKIDELQEEENTSLGEIEPYNQKIVPKSSSLFFEPFNMTPIFDTNLLLGINQISKNEKEPLLNGLKNSAVSYTAKSIEINREGKFSYESIHHENGDSKIKKLNGVFKPQDLEKFSHHITF